MSSTHFKVIPIEIIYVILLLIPKDYDENMCKISKENLEINNYKSKILKSDFQKLVKISNNFDGIVTDLPYGRSSKASEKEISELIKGISFVAKKLGVSLSDNGKGYRSLVNIGENGGQEVPHLHFHLFGGEKLGKMVS